jgi:hypothetical protein
MGALILARKCNNCDPVILNSFESTKCGLCDSDLTNTRGIRVTPESLQKDLLRIAERSTLAELTRRAHSPDLKTSAKLIGEEEAALDGKPSWLRTLDLYFRYFLHSDEGRAQAIRSRVAAFGLYAMILLLLAGVIVAAGVEGKRLSFQWVACWGPGCLDENKNNVSFSDESSLAQAPRFIVFFGFWVVLIVGMAEVVAIWVQLARNFWQAAESPPKWQAGEFSFFFRQIIESAYDGLVLSIKSSPLPTLKLLSGARGSVPLKRFVLSVLFAKGAVLVMVLIFVLTIMFCYSIIFH